MTAMASRKRKAAMVVDLASEEEPEENAADEDYQVNDDTAQLSDEPLPEDDDEDYEEPRSKKSKKEKKDKKEKKERKEKKEKRERSSKRPKNDIPTQKPTATTSQLAQQGARNDEDFVPNELEEEAYVYVPRTSSAKFSHQLMA